MIACLAIPGFELRAALRSRPQLSLRPAALAPAEGTEPLLGPVTAAAEASGIRPGMRLGEALALCPSLVLVEADPQGSGLEWEGILRRLEDAGIAVSPAEPGCAFFETRGVERLYGGVEAALRRALSAVGPSWDARIGAAERKFAALAAAHVARPGQVLLVSDERTREFLAPLPLDLLPLAEDEQQELKELGVRKLGELAGLPGGAVAERLGPQGRRAWSLARGGDRRRIRGRRPPSELVERLEFPEAVGNELTLRRAFNVLLDRLLVRPSVSSASHARSRSRPVSSAAHRGGGRSRCESRRSSAIGCVPPSARSSQSCPHPSSSSGSSSSSSRRRPVSSSSSCEAPAPSSARVSARDFARCERAPARAR
jgi:protein ImuB